MTGRDVLSAAQFSRADIENLFTRAEEFSANASQMHLLDGKNLALLFYEPSVRARPSFENAIKSLGGSVQKAEETTNPQRFVDAVRAIPADAIVLRHPEVGTAMIAAEATPKPIINAGDGTGEHPTQALAELYTIYKEKGTIDNLRIALMGDLKNGRTAHSLALLLSQFDAYVSLVAPAAMSLPYDLSDAMRARGRIVEETNDFSRVLERADAVILAPVNKWNWGDAKRFEKMRQFYRVEEILAKKRADTWLGGRWNEAGEILKKAYDKTQASALAVRTALLAEILA